MKFWPFPIFRNYEENNRVTEIFLLFAKSKNLQVIYLDGYFTELSCEHGCLKFWSANKWYAWGMKGVINYPEGNSSGWSRQLPSRYAVRQIRKALKSKMWDSKK